MYVVPARAPARAWRARCCGRSRTPRASAATRFVRLDTGPLQQRAPWRSTPSEGYTEIGNFNANPIAAYWGEKRL